MSLGDRPAPSVTSPFLSQRCPHHRARGQAMPSGIPTSGDVGRVPLPPPCPRCACRVPPPKKKDKALLAAGERERGRGNGPPPPASPAACPCGKGPSYPQSSQPRTGDLRSSRRSSWPPCRSPSPPRPSRSPGEGRGTVGISPGVRVVPQQEDLGSGVPEGEDACVRHAHARAPARNDPSRGHVAPSRAQPGVPASPRRCGTGTNGTIVSPLAV